MNRIIKISALILCTAAFSTGCIEEDFPLGGGVTTDQISESPFAGEGLLSSMPIKMITNYIGLGEHIDFGYPGIMGATDRMAGEVFPVSGNLPGGNQYYDRWQAWLYPLNSPGLAPDGWGAPFFYINYYEFIKTANDAISAAGDNEAAKEVRGVAKTFRALYYLDLARLYDALPAKAPKRPSYETDLAKVAGLTVPLVTESTPFEDLKKNPRRPRQEMFKFILDDLADAEECLDGYVPSGKNLPSLAVVYGLMARTYLWLGGFEESYEEVPTGVDAYRKAAEYARKAIEASGCSIMTEALYLDPANGFNTVNSAWMWAMIQSTDTVLNNLLSWAAHMSVEAIYGYGYGAQPGISALSYARMAKDDFRRKSFVGPERDYNAIKPYISLTEEEFATIAPYASFKFHTAGGEKNNYTAANVVDIPLMRVEEMYLIEAEAVAHYDAAAGKNLLADFMKTRSASYSVPAGADLIDEIIFQKRIELWGEGLVWADMKRLNMSMHNGDAGSNAPSMCRINTDGRAPWWNCVFPQSAAAQNTILLETNNPDPTQTYDEVK